VTVGLSHRGIQPVHQPGKARIVEAQMAGGLIAVKQPPVSQKRTLEIAGKGPAQLLGGLQGGRVEDASENVIDVVVRLGLWAAERTRLVRRRLMAAALTDESRR
jgi:hypothetical protein